MTRFQMTGSRLIESRMDLQTRFSITHPEVIAAVAQRRQADETAQQQQADFAAANSGASMCPGQKRCPLTPSVRSTPAEEQRQAFDLSDNLSALIFVGVAESEARSEKHIHNHHDT